MVRKKKDACTFIFFEETEEYSREYLLISFNLFNEKIRSYECTAT